MGKNITTLLAGRKEKQRKEAVDVPFSEIRDAR